MSKKEDEESSPVKETTEASKPSYLDSCGDNAVDGDSTKFSSVESSSDIIPCIVENSNISNEEVSTTSWIS